MHTIACSFTLPRNAKRAAEAMIRKGIAPVVDYGIKLSDDGRFEIVWKIATSAPTTDEVETEIAEASADQPAAALPTEANNPRQRPPSPRRLTLRRSPRQAATEPAVALSKPAPNEWPYGTHVMVRKRQSWRDVTIIRHTALDPLRRRTRDGGAIAAGQLPDTAPVVTSNANPHYQKHFDRLFALAKAGDWDGVGNYEVKGSNSYSKMVARYRQDLITVHAASEPAQ